MDELKRLNDSYNTTSEDIIKLEISIYETPTRYTFYWMSKDLVIEQYYFNYIYYQNTLYICNSILTQEKTRTYYLQPNDSIKRLYFSLEELSKPLNIVFFAIGCEMVVNYAHDCSRIKDQSHNICLWWTNDCE